MDPANFLKVSQRLHNSLDEEDRRTAISRSYYALYLILHRDLKTQGVRFTSGGKDHRWLVHYLTTCSNANAAIIGQALNDLQSGRVKADYKMIPCVDRNQSEFAHKKAERTLQLYRGLSPTERTALVQAISQVPPPP